MVGVRALVRAVAVMGPAAVVEERVAVAVAVAVAAVVVMRVRVKGVEVKQVLVVVTKGEVTRLVAVGMAMEQGGLAAEKRLAAEKAVVWDEEMVLVLVQKDYLGMEKFGKAIGHRSHIGNQTKGHSLIVLSRRRRRLRLLLLCFCFCWFCVVVLLL